MHIECPRRWRLGQGDCRDCRDFAVASGSRTRAVNFLISACWGLDRCFFQCRCRVIRRTKTRCRAVRRTRTGAVRCGEREPGAVRCGEQCRAMRRTIPGACARTIQTRTGFFPPRSPSPDGAGSKGPPGTVTSERGKGRMCLENYLRGGTLLYTSARPYPPFRVCRPIRRTSFPDPPRSY